MRESKVKINKGRSGEVTVTLPYAQHPVDNPIYIKKLKEIKGHRWNPEQKRWVFPHSDSVVKRLLDIFKGEDVWVDPSLKQVGKAFRRSAESRKNGSRKLQLAHITLLEDLRREMVSLSADRQEENIVQRQSKPRG